MMTERTPLIAGNWKMNQGGRDGLELARAIAVPCRGKTGVEVVLSPPATLLSRVAELCQSESGGTVGVAAQNLHPAPGGAFTGELSTAMVLEAGCQWAIIGHSERRQYFGETDDSVREKTSAALAAGLRPIVCIGETLEEREAGQTLAVVRRQIDAFKSVIAERPGVAAIAYEPVWAIGTGKVATTEQAEEVHAAIRAELAALDATLAAQTRVLYGGSVKPDNALGLLACPNIDGALVGGASLKADSFLAIIDAGR